MSKKTQREIPADMWLHVATDALARYVAGGGVLEVAIDMTTNVVPSLIIAMPLAPDDPRLAPAFAAMLAPTEATP